MEPNKPAGGTCFYIEGGECKESRFMYQTDIDSSIARFPDQYRKDRPWTQKEIDAYKKRKDKEAKEEKEETFGAAGKEK